MRWLMFSYLEERGSIFFRKVGTDVLMTHMTIICAEHNVEV